MSQAFGEGDIAKSILKANGITQVELSRRMQYGASRMNIILSAPQLPYDFKKKFIEVLELKENPFGKAELVPDNQSDTSYIKSMSDSLERIARQNETLMYQNTQILQLLQQRES